MLWSGQQWYDAPIGSTIPADAWTHLAFTVDAGKISVYINGEAKFAGEAFPNIFEGSAASFSLGVNYWDQRFKGLIDELYIQDGIVLPADEIKALYDEAPAAIPDAPVAETAISQSTLLYGALAFGAVAIARVPMSNRKKSGK
jgi:arabinan endo-1,5-alpha-L-arabinosidase